jgi:hypothetical protein
MRTRLLIENAKLFIVFDMDGISSATGRMIARMLEMLGWMPATASFARAG